MERSWWGWGVTEAAPGPEETTELLDLVTALLPGAEPVARPVPDPAALDLRPPRIRPPDALAQLCSDTPADRAGHTHGKAFRDIARNLEGRLDHPPDLVVRPGREADVVATLEWCADAGIAVVPYGGGTSVVGGVEPRLPGPSVSLDLGRLNRVLEVDRTSRAARIQAGVLGPHLAEQLRPHDLTLRHFPQSFEFSTLGGWLATRAGGHYATLHTHIDDLTESLRVVAPAGVMETRRLPASGAGPSPDRLFLGSEGSLGVITEAWMRVQDRVRWQVVRSIGFDRYDDAVAATRSVAQSGLHPSNCRLLDAGEAFVSTGAAPAGGVLLLGFESADHPVEPSMDRALEIVADHGGRQLGGDDREQAAAAWRGTFLRMPYLRDVLVRHGLVVETFETVCTWDRFPETHAGIVTAVEDALQRVCGSGVVTCRFTHVYADGAAPYFTVYAPGRWGSLVDQWDEIKAAASEAILATGAGITHHHAVGRDHRGWYEGQVPEPVRAAFAAARHSLDPAGIMNPGVLFAEDGAGEQTP